MIDVCRLGNLSLRVNGYWLDRPFRCSRLCVFHRRGDRVSFSLSFSAAEIFGNAMDRPRGLGDAGQCFMIVAAA